MAGSGRTVAGIHAVRNALRFGADGVEALWVEAQRRDGRIRELLKLAEAARVAVHAVARDELDRLAGGANHQGVVARVRVPAAAGEGELDELLAALDHAPLLLILDGVQDPHNLGACLRTAAGAGADAVIAPRDRSVGLTPVACKVASGAAGSIPFVQVTNLARTLRHLGEAFAIEIVGTAGEADTLLYDLDLGGPLALVLGSEEKGMRRLTRARCDRLARLPMAGAVESLNVSVAAGVALYEALRQRRAPR